MYASTWIELFSNTIHPASTRIGLIFLSLKFGPGLPDTSPSSFHLYTRLLLFKEICLTNTEKTFYFIHHHLTLFMPTNETKQIG